VIAYGLREFTGLDFPDDGINQTPEGIGSQYRACGDIAFDGVCAGRRIFVVPGGIRTRCNCPYLENTTAKRFVSNLFRLQVA